MVFVAVGAVAAIAAVVAVVATLARFGRNESGRPPEHEARANDEVSLPTDTSTTTRDSKTAEAPVTTPVSSAVPAARGTLGGTVRRGILARLDDPITISFPYQTPLGVVVRDIKNSTNKGGNAPGIPIYVDPPGLRELGKSLTSTVKIDVKKAPLKNALKQILDQLGLAYVVKDEVLFISSPKAVDREQKETSGVLAIDTSPKTKEAVAELSKTILMPFPNETPLNDLLKYINQGAKSKIYVDPAGLTDAGKTLQSTFSIDLEGVPLQTTLRLLLKQLDLTYVVTKGFLLITSPARAVRLSEEGRQSEGKGKPN